MSTPTKLVTYGAGLIAIFAVMFLAGRALIPDDTVADWTRKAEQSTADHEDGHGAMAVHAETVRGLAVEQDGYLLRRLTAPGRTGEAGVLSFRITDPDGRPLTRFTESHERDLHLIVVRSDGAQFRHEHPSLDRASGTCSIPWTWQRAGTYRVFADFVPGDTERAPSLTLAGDLDVAGGFTPVAQPPSRQASADGYEVGLKGELRAGETSPLRVEITRDGEAVTDLQPYLGAMGHLVALREGDLAFLHVHPSSGLTFEAEAPTPGRYLLYLDFKVGGRVHTAHFVLEAK